MVLIWATLFLYIIRIAQHLLMHSKPYRIDCRLSSTKLVMMKCSMCVLSNNVCRYAKSDRREQFE